MNPYDILEVQITATEDEIKLAYKRLSAKYHPDRNKDADASEKMKNINVAYGILSDPKKRKRYDETGDLNAANTFDRDVEELAVSVFMSYIDTSENIFNYDLKLAMKSSLSKVLNDVIGKVFEVKGQLRHFEKARKKLKAKNLIFAKALDKRIDGMQETIKNLELRKRVLTSCIQLVDEEFEWDDEKPVFKFTQRISFSTDPNNRDWPE